MKLYKETAGCVFTFLLFTDLVLHVRLLVKTVNSIVKQANINEKWPADCLTYSSVPVYGFDMYERSISFGS